MFGAIFILAHIARHLFCRKTCRILYRRYHSGVHFFLIMAYYADFPRALLWFSSLACEIILMTTFGLFCVITFNQQVLASLSAAFLFYLLCRVSDTIYLISQGEILLHTTGQLLFNGWSRCWLLCCRIWSVLPGPSGWLTAILAPAT